MKTARTSRLRQASVLAAAGLATLAVAITGCGGDETAAAEPPAQTMAMDTSMGDTSAAAETNIVETAVAAGQFKTLTSLLQQTGLDKTLAESGPYTVFAPTDRAFAKVLVDQFLLDLEKSREVGAEMVARRGFHLVLLEGAAQLLSPLL